MAAHRQIGSIYCPIINVTALTNVPLQQLRLRRSIAFMTYSTILLAGVWMVHASSSTQSSSQFSISQPTQMKSLKNDILGSQKLLALNVGSNTSAQSHLHLQPYPYKDEDFVIPSIKTQPRYIQRYTKPKSTRRIHSMNTAPVHWIAITLAAISFSKVLFHKFTNSTMNKNSLRPTTEMEDDVDDQNDPDRLLESTSIEEDIDVVSPMADVAPSAESSTVPPEWKEQYDHLIVEATSLREQLSEIQQMLEKQQAEQLDATVSAPENIDDNNDIQTSGSVEDTAAMETEIESLKESVQHWKRVAEMNEQQMSDAIQVERQNGIQQFEQLKIEMLQMVDQERIAIMKEFTGMIQELRDSLKNSLTESNS